MRSLRVLKKASLKQTVKTWMPLKASIRNKMLIESQTKDLTILASKEARLAMTMSIMMRMMVKKLKIMIQMSESGLLVEESAIF